MLLSCLGSFVALQPLLCSNKLTISDCCFWDSAASNIAFNWSDKMSFVDASIHLTFVFADGVLKVSAMTFCFPGLQ